MTNIGSNTLNIARPSKASAAACKNGCGNGNDGCGNGISNCPPNLIRRTRDKVKEKIADYVLLMLGAPRVKIELDEQNLDLAVDQALQIFEDYAPREFFDYLVIRATPGKSVYEMPPEVGIIRAVSYKETANFAFQASDLDGAIPIEYFYPGGAYSSIQGGLIDPIQPIWGRMGEWTLYKQYEHMYSRISSNIGGWEWVGDTNKIKVYPTPFKSQAIIVHYLQKCKDWRNVHQVMQEGALCHAMIMLGNVRGKYTGPIGPGQVTLDGEYMRTKGYELKDQWEEKLLTRFGDILPITMA